MRRITTNMRSVRQGAIALVVGAVMAVVGASAGATASGAVPTGYVVAEERRPVPGLTVQTLTSTAPAQVVHVARISPGARLALRAVLSNEAVAGAAPRLERTSGLCARVRCLVAVNGDFALPGADVPVGGMVVDGSLVRSPSPAHNQLLIGRDGNLAAGSLPWRGTVMASDLAGNSIAGVNVDRGADQLVLYTPAFGPSTATNDFGTELPFEVVEPTGPLRLGTTAAVRLGAPSAGGATTIPGNGGVLSGHGTAAAALTALWQRVQSGAASDQLLIRLDVDGAPIAQSVGGTPVLVRDGRPWFGDAPTTFVRGRHPRTVVGWTAGGDVLLVTADGRQPGWAEGLSLTEAAELLIALGATDAINLDGGGSTTFVEAGAVTNRPSDRLVHTSRGEAVVHVVAPGQAVIASVERPVVSAMAIVASDGIGPRPGSVRLERVIVSPPGGAPLTPADPASRPELALPALVAGTGTRPVGGGLAALATALAIVSSAAAATTWSRRPRPTAGSEER